MEAADEINDTDYVLDVQEELEMLEGADDSSHVKGMNNTQDPLAILYKYHPEAALDYTDTIAEKIPLKVVPAGVTAEVDENHKSQPWLWQYEKTAILGKRTRQLAQGAKPFIVVPPHIVSTREIALLELQQRRLPFIIKRPIPNGTFEYWRLSDLLIL